MRDRASDIKSGKNTVVVKIGSKLAKYYHYFLLFVSFLSALLYTLMNYKSPVQLIFVIAYVPIFKHVIEVYKNNTPKLLDPELKKLAVSTFVFSILFGLGLLLTQ